MADSQLIDANAAHNGTFRGTMTSVDGKIACGFKRGGDTNLGVNQVCYSSKEIKYQFEVKGDSCEVSFDACTANFDNLLRVVSLDGTVEFAKNDDSVGAACCRGKDDDFRKSVAMHCPYSKLEPMKLSPGSYLLVIEGYSNYQGTYHAAMSCSNGCG